MKISWILFASVLIAAACDSKKGNAPLGNWKVDSIYIYYNGVSFMRKDISDEPLIEYLPEGRLKMTKGDETRSFSFQMKGADSLYHHLSNNASEIFVVTHQDNKQLILRQEMNPVFKGANQTRYQIRYLSKVPGQ